jgi:hypothetical protein
MPTPAGNARHWGHRCLLATELIVVVLLVAGGCYSKQNYHVLSPQTGDELLSKGNVVVEGQIVYVRQRRRESWEQNVFFCWPFYEGPQGPMRYDVSIDIDTVLKGDPNMPRRLQVDNLRPLTDEEQTLFAQFSENFPSDVRVRVGYNSRHGNSYRNLSVVPLGAAPTTKPSSRLIPSPPGAR